MLSRKVLYFGPTETDAAIRRNNSDAAYTYLKASGKLARSLWGFYDELWHIGPLSTTETFTNINQRKGLIFEYYSGSHSIATSLVKAGLIVQVANRKCRVTNRTVAIYDVTSRRVPRNWKISPIKRIQDYYQKMKKVQREMLTKGAAKRNFKGIVDQMEFEF